MLQLPEGCNNVSHDLTFGAFMAAAGFPPDATLMASVTGDQGEQWNIYQYQDAACAIDFKTCQDPFE